MSACCKHGIAKWGCLECSPPTMRPLGEWKCGNEYLPYHPQASHVNPDYRDGWNDCYRSAGGALMAEWLEFVAFRKAILADEEGFGTTDGGKG